MTDKELSCQTQIAKEIEIPPKIHSRLPCSLAWSQQISNNWHTSAFSSTNYFFSRKKGHFLKFKINLYSWKKFVLLLPLSGSKVTQQLSEKRLLRAPNWGTEQFLHLKRTGKSTEDVSIGHQRTSYINQKIWFTDFFNTTKIRKLINIHKTHFR